MSLDTRGVQIPNGSKNPDDEHNTGDGWENYDVENLYIVNGVLMHRDWGKNTTIGNIGFYTVDNEAVVSSE